MWRVGVRSLAAPRDGEEAASESASPESRPDDAPDGPLAPVRRAHAARLNPGPSRPNRGQGPAATLGQPAMVRRKGLAKQWSTGKGSPVIGCRSPTLNVAHHAHSSCLSEQSGPQSQGPCDKGRRRGDRADGAGGRGRSRRRRCGCGWAPAPPRPGTGRSAPGLPTTKCFTPFPPGATVKGTNPRWPGCPGVASSLAAAHCPRLRLNFAAFLSFQEAYQPKKLPSRIMPQNACIIMLLGHIS